MMCEVNFAAQRGDEPGSGGMEVTRMVFRNGGRRGGTSRSRRWLFLRLALAAAVAVLIIARYTSPRSLFNPVSDGEPTTQRR